MFVTILTGIVNRQNWSTLENKYTKAIQHPPHGLVQSFLVQNEDQPTEWEIITIWHSREAFERAEESQQTGICEQLFCDAGSTPHRERARAARHFTSVAEHPW